MSAPQLHHDRRCDSSLCHPACLLRHQAELDDLSFPGSKAVLKVADTHHNTRCDSDLCHPECRVRRLVLARR